MEDKLNSIKSLKLNPQYKGKEEQAEGVDNLDQVNKDELNDEEAEEVNDQDDLKDADEKNEDL